MGRSAPVPRGTLPLAVSAAWGPPSRSQGANHTHFDWPSVPRRQVLLFHASACDELTPPIHRTPPGPHAGSSLAGGRGGTPARPLSRGPGPILGFGAVFKISDASAVVHTRSSSRHSPGPVLPGLFPKRSPRRLLTAAASGGLGSPPARRARRVNLHHWHSTVRAGGFYVTITLLSGHTTCPDVVGRQLPKTANGAICRAKRSQLLQKTSVSRVPRTARRRGCLRTASARVGAVLRCGQGGDDRLRHFM